MLCLGLLARAAAAQTADDILARHFEAIGGLDKIRAIKTLRTTGVMRLETGEDVPYVTEKARPNLMRSEFRYKGITNLQGFDGRTAWSFMPPQDKQATAITDPNDVKVISVDADFDGPLLDWRSKGHKIERIKDGSVNGQAVYKLRVTLSTTKVDIYFIDMKTYMVVGSKSRFMYGSTPIYTERAVSDYRKVDGVLFPYTASETRSDATRPKTVQITKIEVNPPIAPSRFALPASTPAKAASPH